MDCKSLMIGDWVMLDKSYPPTSKKPTQLTLTDLIFIAQKEGEECEPIPLTEEILKANGFKYITICTYELSVMWEYSVQVSLYNDGCVTSISKDLMCKGVNKCHICYQGHVHELQHALRLCGLKDFADNFKV